MVTLPIKCPSCGKNVYRVAHEPVSYEELDGALCDNCGRPIAKSDIESQARDIVEAKIAEMLSGLKH
jgi:DNA-directed RNA polymerase subunit N (RpoN/RPB10)